MINVQIDGLSSGAALPVVVTLEGLLQTGSPIVLAVDLVAVQVFAAPVAPAIIQWYVRNVSTGGQIITLNNTAPIDQNTGYWIYPGEGLASFPNWAGGLSAISNLAGGLLARIPLT